jgi:protein-S-isoprenylcysteine O-methyltransferase Ste14
MIVLHILAPIAIWLRPPYTLLGLFPVAGGMGLAFRARRLFQARGTPIKPRETPIHLNEDGPFKVSRNPMYLGIVIALVGIAMLLGSAVTFLFPILFLVAMSVFFIPLEERNLESVLGERYRGYKRRVPRWFLFF